LAITYKELWTWAYYRLHIETKYRNIDSSLGTASSAGRYISTTLVPLHLCPSRGILGLRAAIKC